MKIKGQKLGRSSPPDDNLLFIDTNILLDFYRARNDARLELLGHIDSLQQRIITTYQVEMEFKKNRQAVILEALDLIKKPEGKMSVPAFFKGDQSVKSIKTSMDRIGDQVKKLKERTTRILAEPTRNDPVYKPIQRLFKSQKIFHLTRSNERRFEIRELAEKRYKLGYPPRKRADTSYGDAINWEWIVDCAARSKFGIIIVSRDSDFGVTLGDVSYLNDWLLQEFRGRVGLQRKIILTSRLNEAFKLMKVKVSRKEEEAEEQFIRQRNEAIRRLSEMDAKREIFAQAFRENLLANVRNLASWSRLSDEPIPESDDDSSERKTS